MTSGQSSGRRRSEADRLGSPCRTRAKAIEHRTDDVMMAGTSHRPPAHMTPPSTAGQVVVRLRLIGQMEAWTLTSENVLPAGRKTRALLAVIALSSPRAALRGRLAELLWSRRPEEQARASLRQEIHRLLETLSPAGDRDPGGDPRSPVAPPGRRLGGRGGGDAGDHRPAGLAVAAGRRPAGGPGRHRSHLRHLADHRARTGARPCPHGGRGAAARAGGAGGGDPRGAAAAADRPRARGCLAGADAGACRARRARHGDPGLRPLPRRAGRPAGRRALDRDAEAAGGDPRPLGQPHAAAAAGAAAARRAASSTSPTNRRAILEPRTQETQATRGGAHVGVMPLQLVGTTEEEAHLAPGLAEEITTALARFRWMFVVASNSLARFAAEHARRDGDPPHLRHRLPARRLDPAGTQPAAHHGAPARPARRQPGGLGAAVRPPVERPAVAAGRDRLRGGGADRSRDPADRGQAQRRPPAGRTPPPTT